MILHSAIFAIDGKSQFAKYISASLDFSAKVNSILIMVVQYFNISITANSEAILNDVNGCGYGKSFENEKVRVLLGLISCKEILGDIRASIVISLERFIKLPKSVDILKKINIILTVVNDLTITNISQTGLTNYL
jgi:hypothetical protein